MKKLNNFTKDLNQIDTGEYVVLFREERYPRWQVGLGFNASHSTGRCYIDPEDQVMQTYKVINNRGSLHKNLNNLLSSHIMLVSQEIIICCVTKVDDIYNLQEYKKLETKEQIREFKQSLGS